MMRYFQKILLALFVALYTLLPFPANAANEIGHYSATPPAAALGIFSGDAFANATNYTYTATTGDTVTRLCIYGRFGAGSGTIDVGVYSFSGGVPVTRAGQTTISVGGSDAWNCSGAISISLTGSVVYTLAAANPVGGVMTASADSSAAGAANQDTTLLPATWANNRFDSHLFYIAGDVTAGATSVARQFMFYKLHNRW